MKISNLLFICSCILLISCDDDIESMEEMQADSTLVNELELSIDQNEVITFDFDECNFDLLGDQQALNSFGLSTVNSAQWNFKTLQTKITKDNTELGIKATFLEEPTSALDTEVESEVIKSILESDINDKTNHRFGLEIQVVYNEKSYVSTERNPDFDGSNNPYIYYPDFDFNITSNYDYESDCNDEETIELKGSFSGKLIHISNGVIADSITVDLPDFAILFLN